jgi:hypothetical protein
MLVEGTTADRLYDLTYPKYEKGIAALFAERSEAVS